MNLIPGGAVPVRTSLGDRLLVLVLRCGDVQNFGEENVGDDDDYPKVQV